MPENKRIGSKPAPYTRTDRAGLFTSSGPFIGVIKNNIDPTCAGRLQVYIPHHGGPDENDPGNWITVSYASPFRGQTRQRIDLSSYVDPTIEITDTSGEQENSFQSYGFWFVPPDLNGRVLVFFANGDPSQGYWTSCIQDSMDSHMVPAIGAVGPPVDLNDANNAGYVWQPIGANAIPSHTMLQDYIQISDGLGQTEVPARVPISEPVITNQAISSPTTPLKVKMVPHVFQTRQLGIQGLAFDYIRGTTSASSVRENPSQVFGVSTPGRLTTFANANVSQQVITQIASMMNNGGDTANISNADLQNALAKAFQSTYRTGGHQIVLDDGSVDGLDQGIRIRSTAGNQILLDDTNGQIYIVNSQGTAWIELSPSGFIDIYSQSDYSIRSQGSINFHADNDINMNAGGKFTLNTGGDTTISSGGKLSTRTDSKATFYAGGGVSIGGNGDFTAVGTKTKLVGSTDITLSTPGGIQTNSIPSDKVSDPGKPVLNKHIAVKTQASGKSWWQDGTFDSVAGRAPSHEPWPTHEVNGISTSTVPQGSNSPGVIVRPQNGTTLSGVRGTIKGAVLNEAAIASQPIVGQICGLTVKQTQAFLATLAHLESGFPLNNPGKTTQWKVGNGGYGYYSVNSIGFTGKYQFGASALETYKFMKNGSSKAPTNAIAIGNSANWSGFMGCSSATDFLNNPTAQEYLIVAMMKTICQQLRQWGVITNNSTPDDIAGWLGASHLTGTGGAATLFRATHPNAPYHGPSKIYKTSDANNTNASTYYSICSNAIKVSDGTVSA